MTNDVTRLTLQDCPDCSGTGLWKPGWAIRMNHEYPCASCNGLGRVLATETTEAAPASTVVEELEAARSDRRLAAQNVIEQAAYRDRLESELASARNELARLKAGLETIAVRAKSSRDNTADLIEAGQVALTFAMLRDKARALLEGKD